MDDGYQKFRRTNQRGGTEREGERERETRRSPSTLSETNGIIKDICVDTFIRRKGYILSKGKTFNF